MKTKNQSLSGTTTSRSSLSYIEELITGATQEGLFHVYVSAKYIDDGMVTTLRSNGFSVDKINNFLGDNYDYLINWEDNTPPPTPTPTPLPLVDMYMDSAGTNQAQLGITTTTYPVYVNWGDGSPIDVFNVGLSTTITHNYSALTYNQITVSSIDLATISEFSVGCSDLSGVTVYTYQGISLLTSCQSFSGGTNVNIEGDVLYLPGSLLTYSDSLGSNLYGDIANIPLSITSFESRGDNTLSGDFTYWASTSIINFAVTGQNTIDGVTSSIPSTIQSLELGGFNTIYGTIVDLPTGLINLQLGGNTTVNGRVNILPPNMEVIVIGGGNTVFGEIQNLPSTATYVDIGGNSTLDGDLSLIPANITYFSIGGENTITTYSSPRTWTSNFKNLYIKDSFASGFAASFIDQILNDLAMTSWAVGGNLEIKGTDSPKYNNVTDYTKLINGTSPVNNPVTVTFL
jgi:hypothetical protein